jgi:molybdopterin-containing oxidoreductase family iron-sulfur binding subunit
MSKRAPYPVREEAPKSDSANGSETWPGSPRYWRDLEERGRLMQETAAESAAKRGVNAPEFPKGHFETPPTEEAFQVSRRGLMGAMAATFALVGAEGCRRPLERVVPYTKMPENVIPGVPSHYTTVLQRRGDAVGLVLESHEGRPTKVEGNESHPSSLGGADLVTQATILDFYDPERSTKPLKSGAASDWAAFEGELSAKLGGYAADQGARLRLLMPPTVSPTVLRMRGALAQRFPKARVHTWSAVADSNAREGARIAFGQPVSALNGYDRARVILALDSDFLQTETGNVRAAKLFAGGRRLRSAKDSMSRLYAVEPERTTTGNNADHRLRLPAAEVERYARALAVELGKNGVTLGDVGTSAAKNASADGIPAKWLGAVAKDLAANRGKALVVAGSRQPPVVHALVHAMNAALGAVGATVNYTAVTDADELDAATDIKALTDAIAAKQVDALVILGGNPVYDAPADLGFAETLGTVPFSVHASLFVNETSEKCTWHLPLAHAFESWGDGRALDGSVSIQQPLILPLYGGRNEIELLGLLANAPEKSAHDAVHVTARTIILTAHNLTNCTPPEADGSVQCHEASGNVAPVHASDLAREWNRGLALGVVSKPTGMPPAPTLRSSDIAAALDKSPAGTKVGPASLEVTFAPCPKMVDGFHANNTWLQEMPDPVTKLVWDNAAILSPATAKALGVQNADLIKITVGDRSITAGVWTVPGQADNSIALTLGWGRKKAGRIGNDRGFDVYPLRTTKALGFAVGAQVAKAGGDSYFFAQTQEADHTAGRPIAHETTIAEYRAKPNFAELDSPPPRALPLWGQQDYSQGHQWGMTIDLNACTGCSACVIACMSENNVPVVGKREVWRGREMHWLRLDRYWVEGTPGATEDEPAAIHEPLMCVHCEEAPCENVCPVGATTHGPEGLNEMAYNRCIGTRYCGNNCPYKVRHFNYLNWHNDSVWAPTGGLPETMQMQQNPNVTVRFRGVMEKCTYCVQRIQSAKIRSKREYRELKDGEIRTACQQTCPSDAIVFGDVNDMNSQVTKWSRTDRRFGLLAELGTRPRTTYLGKVRNPNPEMA